MSSLPAYQRAHADAVRALESLRQRPGNARIARRKAAEAALAGHPTIARAEAAQMHEEIAEARVLAEEVASLALTFAVVEAAKMAEEAFRLLADARGVRDEPVATPSVVVNEGPQGEPVVSRPLGGAAFSVEAPGMSPLARRLFEDGVAMNRALVAGTGFSPAGIEKALRDAGRDAEIAPTTHVPPAGTRGTGESPLDFDDLTTGAEMLAQHAETAAQERDDEILGKLGGKDGAR